MGRELDKMTFIGTFKHILVCKLEKLYWIQKLILCSPLKKSYINWVLSEWPAKSIAQYRVLNGNKDMTSKTGRRGRTALS